MSPGRTSGSEEGATPTTPQSKGSAPAGRAVRAFYLTHLLLPLALAMDACAAFLTATHTRSAQAIFLVSVTWLAFGLGGLVLTGNRAQFLARSRRPLLSFYAAVFCLAVFELGAFFIPRRPSLYSPGWHEAFQRPAQADLPGASPIVRITMNEDGLRGPPDPGVANCYRIVAVGGSTTLCAELDDSKTWESRLAGEINQRQGSTHVWVGNAGMNGSTTVECRAVLETVLATKPIDVVLFLVGFNDLYVTLSARGQPTERQLQANAEVLRSQMLHGGSRDYYLSRYPLLRRLQTYQLIRLAASRLGFGPSRLTITPAVYAGYRDKRARAHLVPVPDLSTGLTEYRQRIKRLAVLCQQQNRRCIFLTQPVLWRTEMPPAEESLLWLGNVGPWERPDGYISAADGARAMDRYNEALRSVCASNSLECLDLAREIPKDASLFYDDVHFSESGAQVVAHSITSYLLSRPPFSQRGLATLAAGP